MKKLPLFTVVLAVAILGTAGAVKAQTLTISSPTTETDFVETNGTSGQGANPNILIPNGETLTFTGTMTGAQVQNNSGSNIDNRGTLIFDSAGKFSDGDGYNVLNELGGTTTINSGVFAGSLPQNVEDTGGQLNVNGGTFQSNSNSAGASDILANGSTASVNVTNLNGNQGTPSFTTGTNGVDFMAENDGTILITAPGLVYSLTFSYDNDNPVYVPFTGDLPAGSGTFYVIGFAVHSYTYDTASGGTIALGALSPTPEPLPSTTLALGALGIALLAFRSKRRVKAAS